MARIIDFHAHIYPDKIAERASQSISDFYGIPMRYDGRVDTLIRAAETAGVERVAVQSVATTPEQVCSINDFIAREAAEHPMLVGLGAMHPSFEDFEDEILRMEGYGFRGIKLHPDFQRFYIDDRAMYPLYEALAGRLFILLHTGDHRYDFSSPARLARVLADFPSLTVVAAHFGGWSRWAEATQALPPGRVYVDTSSSLAFVKPEEARSMIDTFGADHVLFGTDYPMWAYEDEFNALDALALSPDEADLIMFENAARLLHL